MAAVTDYLQVVYAIMLFLDNHLECRLFPSHTFVQINCLGVKSNLLQLITLRCTLHCMETMEY